MRQRTIIIWLILAGLFLFASSFVSAQDITLTLPLIPVISDMKDGKPVGPMVDFYNDMVAHYKGGKITLLGIFPFERSIQNIIKGTADFHYPMSISPYEDPKKLPFDYVTERMGKISFILCTKAGSKDLDLKNMGKYNIEIARSQSRGFNFKVTESDNSEASLRKVLDGRIDGFIDAQETTDAVIKANKFKDIKRQLFMQYDFTALVPKTDRGAKVNKILSDILKQMKADKSINKYVGKMFATPYSDWQPADMGW
jgi:polar amino acid transport system substrate-binding protein